MIVSDLINPIGGIIVTIKHRNKTQQTYRFSNIVLAKGREALAGHLIGQKDIFVKNMVFGDGGADDGVKKNIESNRNSLFGITRANKLVVSQIDPDYPTQAVFVAVVGFEEANGYSLNEMALQLSNEDFFSMATFPNIGKTDQIQITFSWRINF